MPQRFMKQHMKQYEATDENDLSEIDAGNILASMRLMKCNKNKM